MRGRRWKKKAWLPGQYFNNSLVLDIRKKGREKIVQGGKKKKGRWKNRRPGFPKKPSDRAQCSTKKKKKKKQKTGTKK